MIFRPELARLVARGKKTQTRRLLKPEEIEILARGQKVQPRYRAGHSYAVQPGRGKSAIARLLVTSVERQLVGDITFEDARAEGFRTRADFAGYWMRLYSKAWPGTERVACEHPHGLPCSLCMDGILDREVEHTDEETLKHFEERFGGRAVWAITFVLDTSHQPRWPHRLSERGYTSNERDAMTDEPEAVDERTQEKITAEARARFDALHQDEQLRHRARNIGQRARKAIPATGRALIATPDAVDERSEFEQHLAAAEHHLAAVEQLGHTIQTRRTAA